MGLIDYHVVTDGAGIEAEALYDYRFFEDGVYIHAARPELAVCFPISYCEIRGLMRGLGPLFEWKLPPVPVELSREILRVSANFAEENLETLFHLVFSPVYPWHDGWELVEPEQERKAASCKPLDDGPGSSYQRSVIEIHSHHSMAAKFSGTDDKDEQGFKLYGVVGRIGDEPEIRFRVGVYGYFWEIPASWVMELPRGLNDCVEKFDYAIGEYAEL